MKDSIGVDQSAEANVQSGSDSIKNEPAISERVRSRGLKEAIAPVSPGIPCHDALPGRARINDDCETAVKTSPPGLPMTN